jgi:hypothetical protein
VKLVDDCPRSSGKSYDAEAEAQHAGRKAAQRDRVEQLIHNKDGNIGSRKSYGKDPIPPKGSKEGSSRGPEERQVDQRSRRPPQSASRFTSSFNIPRLFKYFLLNLLSRM